MNNTTDLSKFNLGDYRPGNKLVIFSWSLINYFIFNSALPWPQSFKSALLRLFGAKVGQGLVLKIKVRIKYPWRLIIGDHCWIGEDVWIDNLEQVTIGNHVCLSQGALLLTGNHDYSKPDFPYRLGKITLEDGTWIGACSVVCPGVTARSHAILTVNSVATRDMEPWMIYSGNPAIPVRNRKMDA
jgi:putative colanic acid biosynthesis acetyltransferase WcaF